MGGDGGNQRELLADGGAPAWSPDGKSIAFVRANPDSGNGELWLAGADGKGAKKLCGTDDTSLGAPVWSADGKQVHYSRDGSIFAVSLGAAVNCEAASVGEGDDPSAAWNGALAFDRSGETGNRLVFGKPKGGSAASLTDGSSDDSDPAWSPDGKKIVFVSDRDGNAEIYVANADGSVRSTSRKTPATSRQTTATPSSTTASDPRPPRTASRPGSPLP